MEELMERIGAAAVALERVAEQMAERQLALAAEAEHTVERIVATVEGQREAELAERLRIAEDKLAEAEGRITQLKAAAQTSAEQVAATSGRKTIAAGVSTMLAKQGIAVEGLQSGRIEAGSIDAALTSLSIEQRFAVKAEMLRSGLLG